MITAVYMGNQRQETILFDALQRQKGNGESKQYNHYRNECNSWIQSMILKIL